jgi:proline iminopeptidase
MVEIEGESIWTKIIGEGIPVILINGGPVACHYLDPLSELLVDSCKVISFEPRGCGRSLNDDTGYGIEVCLQDIEKIREEYNIGKNGLLSGTRGEQILNWLIHCIIHILF